MHWALGLALSTLIGASCAMPEQQGAMPEEQAAMQEDPGDGLRVWFRDADLMELTAQELPVYLDSEPGESDLIERAFPGAPPQVPHTVEDMLPITADDNECVECHHPDNVTGEEDMPIPDTHFERPVMAAGGPGNPMQWVVERYEKDQDLFGARFNCTMCHTPQATNVRTPATSFVRIKE